MWNRTARDGAEAHGRWMVIVPREPDALGNAVAAALRHFGAEVDVVAVADETRASLADRLRACCANDRSPRKVIATLAAETRALELTLTTMQALGDAGVAVPFGS